MTVYKLQGFEEKEQGIYYEYDADSPPLGEGAMGRVYKGVCVNGRTKNRTAVAIKVIYDNIPETVIERARREAAVRINSPYLLQMLGFIEQPFSANYNGHVATVMRYFVIMELLEGVTLYDIMQGKTSDFSGNTISAVKKLHDSYIVDKETTIQKIISKTLQGIKALHNEGYIHRDIDPTNIMITSDGHIKLIDFGICKKLNTLGTSDKNLTATGLFMGKIDYASPELIIGDVQHQNQSTDIYALGILLYQLCTGHLPFSGSDNEVLLAHMRKNIPLKDLKGSPYKKIIIKATQKSQSRRYENACQMLEEIDNLDLTKKDYKKVIVGCVIAIFSFVICIIVWNLSDVLFPNWHEEVDTNLKIEMDNDSILRSLQRRLWSSDENEVSVAFDELSEMAENGHCERAMFEYGLTFSVGNPDFDIPTKRQSILGINADVEKANYWFRRVLENDPQDYSTIYWLLNNLIVKKKNDDNSVYFDEISDLLNKFDVAIDNQNDKRARKYKDAVQNAKIIIENMGWAK